MTTTIIEGSELFRRTMEWADSQTDDLLERGRLMRQVWEGTPWMVNVYTGSMDDYGRSNAIRHWCQDKFGPEAWPIHGKPGTWHTGGATVLGWTWMGFATREMMDEFMHEWGLPPGWVARENGLVGFDILDEKGNVVFQHPVLSTSARALSWEHWVAKSSQPEEGGTL